MDERETTVPASTTVAGVEKESRAGAVLSKRNVEELEAAEADCDALKGRIRKVLDSAKKSDEEESKSARPDQWYRAEPRKRSVPQSEVEYRTFRVAYQMDRTTGKPRITGHAAMFNQTTEVYDWWLDDTYIEEIAPGAFAKTIKEADIRMLFNHSPDWLLGRSKPGKSNTLQLSEDAVGLAIDNDPPETQLVNDLVLVPMERGDLDQMSFAFRVVRHEIVDLGNRKFKRRLLEVELFDVSVVTYPQYEATHAEVVRSAFAEVGLDIRTLGPELFRRRAGLPVDPEVVRSSMSALRALLPEDEAEPKPAAEPIPEVKPDTVPPINSSTEEAEVPIADPTPPADAIPPSPAAPPSDPEPVAQDHSEATRDAPTLAGQPSVNRARRLRIAEAEAELIARK